MPVFYELDLSKCDREKYGPIVDLGKIQVMEGQYCFDLDVIEESLPDNICNYYRYESPGIIKDHHKCRDDETEESRNFLPLGIDFPLPEGAILTQITEI